jgi:UDP-N-acetylmuramoyl-tripeptide--D-alanyl-D-alanine ligase
VEARSLKFVAEACAAEIKRGSGEMWSFKASAPIRGRRAGDLFFAIPGERFDGHDFLNEVAAKGVAAVVLEREKIPAPLPECAVLVVDDTRRARPAGGRVSTGF